MIHQDCEQLLASAIEHFRLGDMEQMRSVCTEAVEAEQTNPDARFLLGMSEFGLENFPNCIEHVGKAITLAPKQADYYELMARAYGLNGQVDDAAKMIREAISLDPENPSMRCLKAAIHRQKGEVENARSSYFYALSRLNS